MLRFAQCSRAPRGFVLKEHKEEVTLPPLCPRVPPERARADAQRTHNARAAHRETCRSSFWTRSAPESCRTARSHQTCCAAPLRRSVAAETALGRGLNHPPLSPRECRLLLDSRRPPGRTVNDWSDEVQVNPAPPSCACALPRGHAIKCCLLQGASLPAAWGEVGSPGWGIMALRAVDGVSDASMESPVALSGMFLASDRCSLCAGRGRLRERSRDGGLSPGMPHRTRSSPPSAAVPPRKRCCTRS